MRSIGIRVQPTAVTFAIYDSEENAFINIETLKVPKALTVPEGLKYVRNSILDILREYGISKAGIRIVESNSQRVDVTRVQIEGVIQETFASSTLEGYFCGQISNISSRIGIARTDFKKYVQGELLFDLIENWEQLNSHEREACLVAKGAVNA